MIPKHLTSRVSVIAIVAGFTAGCGDSGDGNDVTSETTSNLTLVAATTKSTSLSPVGPVRPPTPVIGNPTPGGCSTPDGNVRLPDGTIGSLAQNNTWPFGVVPFRLHPSVTSGSDTEAPILQAIRHYNFMTSVRFVPDTDNSHEDHVLFRSDQKTCAGGGVGYMGGVQEVNLETSVCAFFDTAVHEIGHRVGLHH